MAMDLCILKNSRHIDRRSLPGWRRFAVCIGRNAPSCKDLPKGGGSWATWDNSNEAKFPRRWRSAGRRNKNGLFRRPMQTRVTLPVISFPFFSISCFTPEPRW